MSVCDFEFFGGFAHSVSLLTSRARNGSWGLSPWARSVSLPSLLFWVSLAGDRSTLQIFSERFPGVLWVLTLSLYPFCFAWLPPDVLFTADDGSALALLV